MVEYSLTSELISRLAATARPETEEQSLYYYLDVADSLGPMMAFLLRRECVEEVPFAKIGIPKFDASQCVPQRGEVWVLFCFKDSFRDKANKTTPIRRDGFPLILEWRKNTQDSPLLSGAFRLLADMVRLQLGVEGWGLHPSYSRYCDKIDFSDQSLFADSENVSNVASAYGSILAGLHCAKTGRFPSVWPFPTLQWDPTLGCIAGVAGLREKLAVARDFGANVFTVAKAQERLIAELQGTLNIGTKQLSVYGVRRTSDFEKLASDIAFGAERRKKSWRRLLMAALVPLLVLALGVGAFYWEANRSVFRYYRRSEQLWGQDHGIERIDRSDIGKDGAYEFEYRGFRHGDAGWERKLRRVRRIDAEGVLRPLYTDDLLYCREYEYDSEDKIVSISEINHDGRLLACGVYTKGKVQVLGDDDYELEFNRVEQSESGKSVIPVRSYFAFDSQGRVSKFAEGDGTGRYAIKHFNGDFMDELSFRTMDGQLVAGQNGVARQRTTFYTNGLPAAIYLYGIGDERVLSLGSKIGGVTNVYDSVGNKIWSAYLGLDNQIIEDNTGIAITEYEYDSLGRCVSEKFLSAKGTPTLPNAVTGDAVAIKYEYDPKYGFLKAKRYVNERNEAATANGVSLQTFEHVFDPTGTKVIRKKSRLFGKDERLVETGLLNESAGMDEELDCTGNVVNRTLIGSSGEPINNANGYATTVYEYDDCQRVIFMLNLDVNGDVVPDDDDGFLYMCVRVKYDNPPFIVVEKEGCDGIIMRRIMHRELGDQVYEFVNLRGEPVCGPFGWARRVIKRNEYGWVTEVRNEDVDRVLSDSSDAGIAKTVCDFDVTTNGVSVRITRTNARGSRCDGLAGWCSQYMHYDTRRNLISYEACNSDNESRIGLGGLKMKRVNFSYYKDGNIESVWGTDSEGNTVELTSEGVARIFIEYDEKGLEKRIIGRSSSGDVVKTVDCVSDSGNVFDWVVGLNDWQRTTMMFRADFICRPDSSPEQTIDNFMKFGSPMNDSQ